MPYDEKRAAYGKRIRQVLIDSENSLNFSFLFSFCLLSPFPLVPSPFNFSDTNNASLGVKGMKNRFISIILYVYVHVYFYLGNDE